MAPVVFSVLLVRGRDLGRSGYLQWINTLVQDWYHRGAWLLHTCSCFGGARTSKQEQDTSNEVWQEYLWQASNPVRTTWNYISWGKFIITYRELKAQGTVGKSQQNGEGVILLSVWTLWCGPFQVLVHKHLSRGNKGLKLEMCMIAELCFCWDIRGKIPYMTGVLHMWVRALWERQSGKAVRKACALCKGVAGWWTSWELVENDERTFSLWGWANTRRVVRSPSGRYSRLLRTTMYFGPASSRGLDQDDLQRASPEQDFLWLSGEQACSV